ncbi:MAG: hypothetical protein JWQ71_236, partial [Pedosphaera sp.]|nr:hypothetical protein [Pedosphaera sp.]
MFQTESNFETEERMLWPRESPTAKAELCGYLLHVNTTVYGQDLTGDIAR